MQDMRPESSTVNVVNLVKNLPQFQRYRIFPRGLPFWRALYKYKYKYKYLGIKYKYEYKYIGFLKVLVTSATISRMGLLTD